LLEKRLLIPELLVVLRVELCFTGLSLNDVIVLYFDLLRLFFLLLEEFLPPAWILRCLLFQLLALFRHNL
jgi:hypothetical protein